MTHYFEIINAGLLGVGVCSDFAVAIGCYTLYRSGEVVPLGLSAYTFEVETLACESSAVALQNNKFNLSSVSLQGIREDCCAETDVNLCGLIFERREVRSAKYSDTLCRAESNISRHNIHLVACRPILEAHQLAHMSGVCEQWSTILIDAGCRYRVLDCIGKILDIISLYYNIVVELYAICRVYVVVTPKEIVEVLRYDFATNVACR